MRTLVMLLSIFLLVAVGDASAKTERSKAVLAEFQKLHPCPVNGKSAGPCPGYIKDHIKPLCAGGADAVHNLQWQTLAEAKAKDKLELQQCSASKSNKDAPVTKSARSKPYSDNTCHTGPRGGRYRIVNGHKRYGC